MTQIDPVVLKLQAELGAYNRDLANATRLTEDKLARIDRAGYNTGRALRKGFDLAKGAAVAFAASISVQAVVGAIKSGLEYAANLGEQAKALGITSDAFQEYSYAATQVGLTQGELETGIIRLTRSLGEAADDAKGPAAKAFQKLGVNIRDANGEVRNAADILPDIAQGYAGLGSDAERTAVGFDILGRGAAKFGTLLEGGAQGVNELRNAAHELGIVLTSEQIQKADDAADRLEAVKKILEARIAGVVADNSGAILELANSLSSLADRAIKAFSALQKLSKTPLGRFLDKANSALSYATPAGLAMKAIQRGIEISEPQRTGGAPARKPVRPVPKRTTPLPGLSPYTFNAAPESDNPFGAPGAGGFAALAILASAPAEAAKVVAAMTAEVEQLEADVATARAALSGDLAEAAAAEKQQIDARSRAEIERLAADAKERGIDNSRLIAGEQLLASLQKQAVDQRLAQELAEKARDEADHQLDLRRDQTRREIDALSAESDLADTRTARLAIERRILELRQQAERDELEAQIARDATIDAERARASLAQRQGSERTGLDRAFGSPLARYARESRNDSDRVEEATVRYIGDLRDTVSQTMARELGIKNKFVAELISIFLDKALFGPLADALSGGSGGGGILGGIVAGIGALFGGGRASGGRVNAGTMYRINEGASPGRVEGFIPQGSGMVVPLGRMNATRGGGGTVVQHFHLDARGAVMTQDLVNQINQMGQVAAFAGARDGHAASMNEIRKLQRPKL